MDFEPKLQHNTGYLKDSRTQEKGLLAAQWLKIY